MRTIRLDSRVTIVGRMPRFDEVTVREERSLGWSTLANASRLGGPITQSFIEHLPDVWRGSDVAIQVKMTWLKRGWTAGPIGFHCDWLAVDAEGRRTQPDQAWPQAVAAVVGDCAMTRFIVGEVELPAVPTQADQSRDWAPWIERQVAARQAEERLIEPSTLFRFGPSSVHGRSRAKADGWRVILRAIRRPGHTPFTWNQPSDTVLNVCLPSDEQEARRFARYAEDGRLASSLANLQV